MPFDREEFLSVFARYNESLWPVQILLYAIGLAAVLLAARSSTRQSAAVPYTLAFLWTWMAVAYHLFLFRTINPVATLFGIAFLVQAGIFSIAAGRAVGPVAVMADADDYAIAAAGGRLDVWLLDDGVVTYVRATCLLGAP